MHGMHSVFLANTVNSEEPISDKKMIEKDGQWRVEEDILGWIVYWVEKNGLRREEN